ncbi:MAG: PilW family protein [Nitrospiraceae bacterium]
MVFQYLNERGTVTVAELLAAVVMTAASMGAMYSMMIAQNQVFSAQDRAVEMDQTARTIMNMISRDLRMAGYNPVQGISFNGITYDPVQLHIQADLNGNGVRTDTNEDITYSYDAANLRLLRTAPNNLIVFQNIQAFTFSYLDSNGSPTTTSADVRQVMVSITARAARPDPAYPVNNGYRTLTLASRVTPRDLGF